MLCIKCHEPFTARPGDVVCKKCWKQHISEKSSTCICCGTPLTRLDSYVICKHCSDAYIAENKYLPGGGNITKQEAEEALNRAETVVTSFKMLLDGRNIKEIAEAIHMTRPEVSRLLYRHAKTNFKKKSNTPECTSQERNRHRMQMPNFTESYPNNVYCAVFGVKVIEELTFNLPLDLKETMDYVCSGLKKNEQAAFHLRYQDGMTLGEAGAELHISGERVRQIITRGLKRMRSQENINYLINGLKLQTAFKDAKVKEEELKKKQIAVELEQINKKLERHKKELLQRLPQESTALVTDLALTTRAKNALKHFNINTVQDFIKECTQSTKVFDYCGRKTRQELHDAYVIIENMKTRQEE